MRDLMSKELLQKCYTELHKLNGLVVKSDNVDCRFDDLLNEISVELMREELTIDDYFREWEKSIDDLKTTHIELINLKETYAQLEQEIVENTNFKELYGANNQKVRDNHVKNELKDLVDIKHELKLKSEYLSRRIDFIKNLMAMQRTLIESGAIDY
jgi:hypothetical protein